MKLLQHNNIEVCRWKKAGAISYSITVCDIFRIIHVTLESVELLRWNTKLLNKQRNVILLLTTTLYICTYLEYAEAARFAIYMQCSAATIWGIVRRNNVLFAVVLHFAGTVLKKCIHSRPKYINVSR